MTHSIHDVGHRPANSWTGYLGLAVMLAVVCLGFSPQSAFSADKYSFGAVVSLAMIVMMLAVMVIYIRQILKIGSEK